MQNWFRSFDYLIHYFKSSLIWTTKVRSFMNRSFTLLSIEHITFFVSEWFFIRYIECCHLFCFAWHLLWLFRIMKLQKQLLSASNSTNTDETFIDIGMIIPTTDSRDCYIVQLNLSCCILQSFLQNQSSHFLSKSYFLHSKTRPCPFPYVPQISSSKFRTGSQGRRSLV